jgi:hypothetical protein
MTDDRKEPTLSPLKPDQDEILRHRQRTAEGATPRTSTANVRANTGSHRPVVVRSKLAPFAFLLAITGLGLAGFAYWQLLEAEKAAEAALVRIADLESRLELTGDETQASAAAMQAKLKWADSEIRKLWGVSYDTNRKDIAANKDAIAAARKQAGGIESRVNASVKEMRAEVTLVNDLVEAQQSTLDEVERNRLQLQKQTQQLADALNQVESTQADLQSRVKATEQAIEAIDKFRISVNRDLLELRQGGTK